MKKIGLIVNPIAGMGGAVGLKGTDGDVYEEALDLGADPVTPDRTKDFLSGIEEDEGFLFLVGSNEMGENYLEDFNFTYRVVEEVEGRTTAEDTKRIASKMLDLGVDLIVFVGGDGTARDVYDSVDQKVPVIGIPGGVKIFSSVFAVSARAAAELFDSFLSGADFTEREVLDIDEVDFRDGSLSSELYGYLNVVKSEGLVQGGKEASGKGSSTKRNKKNIAKFVVENLEPDKLYLLGPGTTVKAIADELEVSKTLLGIDAVYNGDLVGSDVNENEILQILKEYKNKEIIVTPIGGNGFIFGRGSKQFTPDVIRKVGTNNIRIIGDKSKIRELESLRVDTGDVDLDRELCGNFLVVTGYKEEVFMEVKC